MIIKTLMAILLLGPWFVAGVMTDALLAGRAIIIQPWSVTLTANLARHPALANKLTFKELTDD